MTRLASDRSIVGPCLSCFPIVELGRFATKSPGSDQGGVGGRSSDERGTRPVRQVCGTAPRRRPSHPIKALSISGARSTLCLDHVRPALLIPVLYCTPAPPLYPGQSLSKTSPSNLTCAFNMAPSLVLFRGTELIRTSSTQGYGLSSGICSFPYLTPSCISREKKSRGCNKC